MTPAAGFGIIAGIFAVAGIVVGLATASYNDDLRYVSHSKRRGYLPSIILGTIACLVAIFAVLLAVRW